jgi:hypothetical protein
MKSKRLLATATLLVLLVCAVGIISMLVHSFPDLEPEEREHMLLPTSIEQAKQLSYVLKRYTQKYYFNVLAAYLSLYIT